MNAQEQQKIFKWLDEITLINKLFEDVVSTGGEKERFLYQQIISLKNEIGQYFMDITKPEKIDIPEKIYFSPNFNTLTVDAIKTINEIIDYLRIKG